MLRCNPCFRTERSWWVVAIVITSLSGILQAPLQAGEVPWLNEVATVPTPLPSPTRPLKPVLQTEKGESIRDLAGWQARRKQLRESWLKVLGPLPSAPPQMSFEVLESEDLEKCTRHLIQYEVEPGRIVQAYLLKPKTVLKKPYPALVVFHGTTTETSKSVAGLGSKPHQRIGLQLAEQGFVVLCPSNFLWEQSTYLKAVAAARERHPESLGMATMLADGIRAVDLLLTIPEVDAERIGTIGHSLGAKEAMYLMAFDDRVQAGVASEGGVGLDSTNWEAPWYLGPASKNPDFGRDHHELVALIAPRPFLVLGGETGRGCADGERSWPYIEAGQQVSKLYGEIPRQGLLNHHEGHLLSPASAAKSFEWLQVYIAQRQAK
jgi:dienelactone hydrolase